MPELCILASHRSSHVSTNQSNLCPSWVSRPTGPIFARVVYLGQSSLEPRQGKIVKPVPELGISANNSNLCPSCVCRPVIARATSRHTSLTCARVGYLDQQVQSLSELCILANQSNLCPSWVSRLVTARATSRQISQTCV